MLALKRQLSCFTSFYLNFILRFPKLVVFIFICLSLIGIYYTVENLKIDTSTENMLDKTLDWRKNFDAHNKKFPQYKDNILVVISGDYPELVDVNTHALAKKLKTNKNFSNVFIPTEDNFFITNGLLYLSVPQLQTIVKRLNTWSRINAGKVPTIDRLLELLHNNLTLPDEQNQDFIKSLETQVISSIQAATANKKAYLSWQELFFNQEPVTEQYTRFIILKPKLDYSKLFPAKDAIDSLKKLISNVKAEQDKLSIVQTGQVALAHEELISVNKGITIAALLSLFMVAIILYLSLRSVWLVAASLITLIAGLIATSACAAINIGHLNLISISFAVLYIGLSIDFAIHLCCRFQEEAQNHDSSHALILAIKSTGTSLAFCALTTAIGFYAFIPTTFKGVSELGLISGTGLIISFLFSVSLLPALIKILPSTAVYYSYHRHAGSITDFFAKKAKFISFFAIIIFIVALTFLPKADFIADPMKLRDPEQESVITYNALLKSKTPPTSIVSLVQDSEAAELLSNRVLQLDTVSRTQSLGDYIPRQQTDKLTIIPEIMQALQLAIPTRINVQANIDLDQFNENLNLLQTKLNDHKQHNKLKYALNHLDKKLQTLNIEEQRKLIQLLQEEILTYLPIFQYKLMNFAAAKEVTIADLPPAITSRWQSKDGTLRVEIFPKEDLFDTQAIHRFVTSIQQIVPTATGMPVVYEEAGNAVVNAFKEAFSYALLGIILLLITLFRNIKTVLLVMIPLLFASVCTGAASVILNIPFNFANIIALPLLLGVGVDSGIHLIHRAKEQRENTFKYNSTTVAIIASALTTVCSFGNLAFSPHLGMASMGKLLSIGMLLTLFATIVLLPAIMGLRRQN